MANYKHGEVSSYDATTKHGKMRFPGETQQAVFSLNTQRLFLAGFDKPVFGAASTYEVPRLGDPVVAILAVRYESEITSRRHSLFRRVEVREWGFKSSYELAEQAIAARPIYEVVEFVLYNGKPVSVNQRRLIITGSAIQIEALFPREVEDDPLAPERNLTGFTYRRRFYLRVTKNGKSRKLQCEDPRPVPAGKVPGAFQPTNECGEILATAEKMVTLLDPPVGQKHTRQELAPM